MQNALMALEGHSVTSQHWSPQDGICELKSRRRPLGHTASDRRMASAWSRARATNSDTVPSRRPQCAAAAPGMVRKRSHCPRDVAAAFTRELRVLHRGGNREAGSPERARPAWGGWLGRASDLKLNVLVGGTWPHPQVRLAKSRAKFGHGIVTAHRTAQRRQTAHT